MGDLKKGLIVGAASGLGASVLMRLVVRIIAMASEGQPRFSIEGTAYMAYFGTVVGAFLGAIYTDVRSHLPGDGVSKGALYGLILWGLGGVPTSLLHYPKIVSTASPLLTFIMLSTPLLLYGVVLEVLIRRGSSSN